MAKRFTTINLVCVVLIATLVPVGCLDYQVIQQQKYHILGDPATFIYGILDYTHNWVVLFNGNTGSVYFIHYKSGTIWYLPCGVWDKNKTDFFSFLETNHLETIYKKCLKEGFMSFPETASPDINKDLMSALYMLSTDLRASCQSIATLMRFALVNGGILGTTLKGVEDMISPDLIKIEIDLLSIKGLLHGLDKLVGRYDDGLSTLVKNNFVFDFKEAIVAQEDSGFQVFIEIMTGLVSTSQNLDVLSPVLNNDKEFFELVACLSGGKVGGDKVSPVNRFSSLFWYIICYLEEELSKENLKIYLKEYLTIPIDGKTLEKKWFDCFTQIDKKVFDECNLKKTFKHLHEIVQQTLKKKYVYKDVNLSNVTKKLFEAKKGKKDEKKIDAVVGEIFKILDGEK